MNSNGDKCKRCVYMEAQSTAWWQWWVCMMLIIMMNMYNNDDGNTHSPRVYRKKLGARS